MNQKNFEYLRDQVKFTGFGEGLEDQLREKLASQAPEFSLEHKHEFGKDQTTSVLNFKKSDQTDNYFFNSYKMNLQQAGKDDSIGQTFYIGKENNFTFKEAYNLLSGRAVNKDLVNNEGEKYNAWVQLDFKETQDSGNFKKQYFNEKYGFDLEKALAVHPIKELNNSDEKDKLIESLQKGNRQSVKFDIGGTEEQRFVEANPKFKSVNVYDSSNQRMRQEKKEEVSQDTKAANKVKNSQAAGDSEGEPSGGKSNNRKKKQGQSI